jgi:hypothetical protein
MVGVIILRGVTKKEIISFFHFFGSKNNLMLKMLNLCIKICCPYIMETYGMIWNEHNEKKLKNTW